VRYFKRNPGPRVQYEVDFSVQAMAFLNGLTDAPKRQIGHDLYRLQCALPDCDTKPLKGYRGVMRLRSGDYRIVYQKKDSVMIICAIVIEDRKRVYQVLKRVMGS